MCLMFYGNLWIVSGTSAEQIQSRISLPVSAKAVLPEVLNESHHHEPRCLLKKSVGVILKEVKEIKTDSAVTS